MWTVRRCDSAKAGANDIPTAQGHFKLDWMFLAHLIQQIFLKTIGVVKVVLKLARKHLLSSHQIPTKCLPDTALLALLEPHRLHHAYMFPCVFRSPDNPATRFFFLGPLKRLEADMHKRAIIKRSVDLLLDDVRF